MNNLENPQDQTADPNYKPVYKGGGQSVRVPKDAINPPKEDNWIDDMGRILFEE